MQKVSLVVLLSYLHFAACLVPIEVRERNLGAISERESNLPAKDVENIEKLAQEIVAYDNELKSMKVFELLSFGQSDLLLKLSHQLRSSWSDLRESCERYTDVLRGLWPDIEADELELSLLGSSFDLESEMKKPVFRYILCDVLFKNELDTDSKELIALGDLDPKDSKNRDLIFARIYRIEEALPLSTKIFLDLLASMCGAYWKLKSQQTVRLRDHANCSRRISKDSITECSLFLASVKPEFSKLGTDEKQLTRDELVENLTDQERLTIFKYLACKSLLNDYISSKPGQYHAGLNIEAVEPISVYREQLVEPLKRRALQISGLLLAESKLPSDVQLSVQRLASSCFANDPLLRKYQGSILLDYEPDCPAYADRNAEQDCEAYMAKSGSILAEMDSSELTITKTYGVQPFQLRQRPIIVKLIVCKALVKRAKAIAVGKDMGSLQGVGEFGSPGGDRKRPKSNMPEPLVIEARNEIRAIEKGLSLKLKSNLNQMLEIYLAKDGTIVYKSASDLIDYEAPQGTTYSILSAERKLSMNTIRASCRAYIDAITEQILIFKVIKQLDRLSQTDSTPDLEVSLKKYAICQNLVAEPEMGCSFGRIFKRLIGIA